MRPLTIATNNIRRMLRDRSNIFFVFMFPMLLILVIGATFGGGFQPRLAVVENGAEAPLATELVIGLASLSEIEIDIVASRTSALDAVERGRVNAAVVIPEDYDASILAGTPVTIEFLARQDQLGQQMRTVVDSVVAEQASRLGAAAVVALLGGMDFDQSLQSVDSASALVAGVTVEQEALGERLISGDLGRFDLGAAQQLLLFTFLTSLAASAALIQTRQWGVTRRMLATPTPTSQILVGESLGRFGVALVQSLFIMGGALVAFGVNWGDPLAAIVLVVMFSLVGSGAGMLLGSLFNNDQQAGSLGVFAGLGLAALGGCMVPLEIFSSTMQNVAHITPHAWALDGFAELVRRGGTIGDILPELAALAGYAAMLLTAATLRLRHVLTA